VPKATPSTKDEIGSTVDIEKFEDTVNKDDHPNDMDIGQSLA
jgi:hypothetical protein